MDKCVRRDAIEGNPPATVLARAGPGIRPAFAATNHFILNAWQFSETHTFSPTTVNEANFGYMRDEGIQPKTGLFSVPLINVTGQSTAFGNGFAAGDFIQHNYHWRGVLTPIRASHTLTFRNHRRFRHDLPQSLPPLTPPT